MKIFASILNADLANLAREVTRLKAAGITALHIDVMDGVFVPPMTVGDVVVRSLRENRALCGDMIFDTHLMVANPSMRLLANFAQAGSDVITIHVEGNDDIAAKLAYIRELGCKAGLAFNPETPVSAAAPYVGAVDMFTVMSVRPGYGGQAFIPESLNKIAALRAELKSRGIVAEIEVDGGINAETAPSVIKAGADILVSGSYLFNAENMAEAVKLLLSTAR